MFNIIYSFILQIDYESVNGKSPGNINIMSDVPDIMYFGGYPGEHNIIEVTNDDFNGCIDEVFIDRAIDLSLSRETIGTLPGCKQKVSRSNILFLKNVDKFYYHN